VSALNIIQGEDRTLTVLLKDGDGNAYDLTGNTEITALFCAAAGGTLPSAPTKTGGEITIVGSADCGKIQIVLTDADTALLATGNQDFEIELDAGTDKRIVQLLKAINVLERVC